MTVILAYLFSFSTFLLFPTIVLCLNTALKYREDRPTSVCQPIQTDVKVFQTTSISLAQAAWKHAIEKAKAMQILGLSSIWRKSRRSAALDTGE